MNQQFIDCNKCENRGKVNGLSQDTFCDSCIHSGTNWKKDHYLCKKTHLERINDEPVGVNMSRTGAKRQQTLGRFPA